MFSTLTLSFSSLTVHLSLGGLWWIFACVFVGLFLLGFITQLRGVWFRFITAMICLVLLSDPSIVQENRKSVPSKFLIVNDMSSSMDIGARSAQRNNLSAHLRDTLTARANVQVETLDVAGNPTTVLRETDLFDPLAKKLNSANDTNLSGIAIITDGQIHDVPADLPMLDENVPVHFFIAGRKDDVDRQIIINNVNTYGLVGQTLPLTFTVTDKGRANRDDGFITVRVTTPDGQDITLNNVSRDEPTTIDIPIVNAGQNVVEIKADTIADELTTANNTVALTINGVRGSLKVLLVSGNANIGERTWRNFLKSDPGVDLVHFTILRQPDKIDPVPADEMSLIVFPFQELFQEKIEEFDLIIFDHYSLQELLPTFYLGNIKTYVENGGALLIASGVTYAQSGSIYNSPLREILPARPAGEPLNQLYKPQLTNTGKTHPVTAPLTAYTDSKGAPSWGPWGRQIPVETLSGSVLMEGIDDLPLLILSRVKEGRIGHITSDQIWLWSREYQGGGPHAQLLKRLVHWLMKEPTLDEEALDVTVRNQEVTVRQRVQDNRLSSVLSLELPDGEMITLDLKEDTDKLWRTATFQAQTPGVYTIDDGVKKRPVVIGDINPPELLDSLATPEKVKSFLKNRRGSTHWIADMPSPVIRDRRDTQTISGSSWIGMRQANNYTVTDITTRSLLPDRMALFLIGLILFINWWREGRLRPILKDRSWVKRFLSKESE